MVNKLTTTKIIEIIFDKSLIKMKTRFTHTRASPAIDYVGGGRGTLKLINIKDGNNMNNNKSRAII